MFNDMSAERISSNNQEFVVDVKIRRKGHNKQQTFLWTLF